MADSYTDFNTHPQPRTFAPSKEDVLQNLQYFFGAPVSPEKLKDYSEHHAMTCASAAGSNRTLSPGLPLDGHRLTVAPFPFAVRRPLPGRASRPQTRPRQARHPHTRARRQNTKMCALLPARPSPTTALPLLTRVLPLGSRDTLNNLILKSPQNWRECRPLEPRAAADAHALPLLRRDERRPALLPD